MGYVLFWLLALDITFYHSIYTVVVFFSSFESCFSCVFGYVIADFVAFLFFAFFAVGVKPFGETSKT